MKHFFTQNRIGLAWALGGLLVAGCAVAPEQASVAASTAPPPVVVRPETQVLLLGEQHDAPAHQAWQRATVQALAAEQRLAALVLEMAEQGRSTQALPREADAARVREALAWDEAAWPWQAYGPVVMAAVRAGVPVLGGNLPRAQMRPAIDSPVLDAHLPAAALERQRQALREGHCGEVPEPRIARMLRVQLARDAAMAQTVYGALQRGRTVVLVAGAGHVLRSVGVPTHLPPAVRTEVAVARVVNAPALAAGDADQVQTTPALPPHDHCAALRGGAAAR